MSIQFASPWWLLTAIIVPIAFYRWWRFSRSPWLPRRFRLVPYLRAAALFALTLTLAQTSLWRVTERSHLHVVHDVSFSALSALHGGDDPFFRFDDLLDRHGKQVTAVTHYVFGEQTRIVSGDDPSVELHGINQNETHIENALRLVLHRITPDENHRILLISDGLETVGNAEKIIPEARAKNVPIDVYPIGPLAEAEVMVERLVLPGTVTIHEPYRLQGVVVATHPMDAHVMLYRNGTFIGAQNVRLQAGRNVIPFAGLVEEDPHAPEVITYELRVTADQDNFPQNNVGYGVVTRQDPAHVLILSRDESAGAHMAHTLEGEGFTVQVARIGRDLIDAATLSAYRALVLIDLPASFLSPGEMEAIGDFVEYGGGGLLAIGGPNSFGLGDYAGTRLERILPVTMDVPQQVIIPSLAMLLVLDRSGSMSETQGLFSKLDLAKEASLGVLDLLHENDLFGVIAFDSEAEWIVPLQRAENQLAIAARIAALRASGGTNLGAALEQSYETIAQAEAAVKHLIALTDGRSMPADFESLTQALHEAGVTVSTVGIGRDADRELLKHIADWGGGRFYYTDDIRSIPKIFATETTVVTRPIRADTPFTPVWHQGAEFWESRETLPSLGGHVMATPKATAAVYLQTPDDYPILTGWRSGLGRSAAFLSDITGQWAGDWLAWPEYGRFLGQLLRFVFNPSTDTSLFPYARYEDGKGIMTVDALDRDGRFQSFLPLSAEVFGPDGTRWTLTLEEQEPGRYIGVFPAAAQGAYAIYVAGSKEGPTATTGLIVPYPEEFRIFKPDTGLLPRLAGATGGTVLHHLDESSIQPLFTHPHPTDTVLPLAPFLLGFSFFAFFTDIVIRYLRPLGFSRSEPPASTQEEAPPLPPGHILEQRMEAALQHQHALREPLPMRKDQEETEKTASARRFLARRRKYGVSEDDEQTGSR